MLKTMFNTKLRRKAYNLYEMHLNYFEAKPVKRNQYRTSFSFPIKKFHIQSIPNLQILIFFSFHIQEKGTFKVNIKFANLGLSYFTKIAKTKHNHNRKSSHL
ncbi:hypothetical protein V6Z11_D01G122400 [Gossypium hirsutum]